MTLSELRSLKNNMNRLLGIDWGEKRWGISLSDTLWIIANPLTVIDVSSFKDGLCELQKLVALHNIAGIVIGNPINMNGSMGFQSERVQKFAEKIRESCEIPVILWDERWSTAGAWQALNTSEISRKKKEKSVDKVASSFILQGALEALR